MHCCTITDVFDCRITLGAITALSVAELTPTLYLYAHVSAQPRWRQPYSGLTRPELDILEGLLASWNLSGVGSLEAADSQHASHMSAAPTGKPASLPSGKADLNHKEGKRKRNPDLQPNGDTTPPALKRGRQISDGMKRTPQGNLTQSRLTGSGMLKIQQNGDRCPPPDRDESCSENDSFVSSETITSPGSPAHPPVAMVAYQRTSSCTH